MRILSADLNDYSSFRECPTIEFREGINLVVGVNNSGKSALLKALNPTLPAQANRSEERFRGSELPSASATLRIQFSCQRLARAALDMREVYFPLPHNMRSRANQQEIDDFWSDFFKNDRHSFSVPFHGNGNLDQFRYPAHGLFEPSNNPNEGGFVRVSNKEGKLCFDGLGSGRERDSVPSILSSICREDIFNFSAERLNVGVSPFGNVRRLSHNADNLPAFLHTLMGERGSINDRLKDHLRAIFPTFGNLTIRSNLANGLAEILIWPTTAMEQPELAFPLSESGTGLGQVIAILSVVMTTTESVIIIDEINSFLHPGAVKALLKLFQTEYSQHQYIISTHSPEVLSFSNPATVHLVQRNGYKSTVRPLDLGQLDQLQETTRQLGISMADVFSADRIIWVEGPSEERCFPEVYQRLAKKEVPSGTKILAVSATGDFLRKRDKKMVFDIYRRLSAEASRLSSVSFSFDSEDLSDQAKRELKHNSQGELHFLPRRHLECYLIHPQSIAEFIDQKNQNVSPEKQIPTTEDIVCALKTLANSEKFREKKWQENLEDPEWLSRIDAANLIKKVCESLTNQRITFNKNRDSLLLLQMVIKNNPSQLKELKDYVQRLVDGLQ